MTDIPYRMSGDGEEELSIGGFSQFTSPTSVATPSCYAIQKARLPPGICAKAIEVYYRLESKLEQQIHPVKSLRNKRKTRRIFLYVFIAYNELQQPKDPAYIARIVGLDSTEIETAYDESSIDIIIDPTKLSRFYIETINSHFTDAQFDLDVVEREVQKIIDTCKRTGAGRENRRQ